MQADPPKCPAFLALHVYRYFVDQDARLRILEALALPSLVAGWRLRWHDLEAIFTQEVMLSDRAKVDLYRFQCGDATN